MLDEWKSCELDITVSLQCRMKIKGRICHLQIFSATNFSAFMKCVDMLLTITVSLQCRKKIRKKIKAEFATCMNTEK